ncbi:MAG TPA: C-terminal binding protein [Patescibacteria group bacterium]|nr:C-terminal binding protein [Patescibacteria group bacterium]
MEIPDKTARRLVVVTDSVFPNLDPAREVLSKIGADLQFAQGPEPEAILQAAERADAVLTTYAKVTADVISRMTRCRIISRFGIGVDNVDIASATKSGIVVTRVPDYCIDEVSEHAVALLLALVRKIPFINARTQGGTWEMKAAVPIHRLRGTTLGLVAFGRIPQLVAPKAQAFGMRVVTYDPYISQEVLSRAGVARVEFDELVKISDCISIHTPLTQATHHLFNAAVFSRMKPTAYLINTARGAVVEEVALAQALDRRQIAGAALDVMEKEPPTGSPLFGRDNVIITPHTSFYSEESLVDLQTKAAEEVVRVLSGEEPRNPVNPEALKFARSS